MFKLHNYIKNLPNPKSLNKDSPFFCIITCTSNVAASLEACIKSVEQQTFHDYEHLFIDGESSDGTVEIIKAYKARKPNHVHIHHLKRAGVTSAMNKGIEVSTGKVILHLHGDDRLAGPEVLASVKHLFDKTAASLVIGNCRLEGHPVRTQTWPEISLARYLYKVLIPLLIFQLNPIAHPSTFVSREVFTRRGKFDENYQVVMDYEFWFRVIGREKYVTTDQILSVYRFHTDTISSRQMQLGLREITAIQAKYRSQYPLRYFVYAAFLKPLFRAKRLWKERSF